VRGGAAECYAKAAVLSRVPLRGGAAECYAKAAVLSRVPVPGGAVVLSGAACAGACAGEKSVCAVFALDGLREL
jgi:hypothetical protein